MPLCLITGAGPRFRCMHTVDAAHEQMIRSVLAYAGQRLRRDPVPLDGGPPDPAQLGAALRGMLTAEGNDPEKVLRIYADTLAPAVISADSPRFLGFIPAAPTKAALLFDMLISCASIQGTSWLEAAGAIQAENQVLRLIADLAGLPASAGGCFVSGGSAGNLSALVVAREMATRNAGPAAAGRRWRVAVGADAHSSVISTLRILGMDALTVRTDDHRVTGEALRAALDTDGDPSSVAAVAATAGTTNAGIIDDLAGIAAVAKARGLWFHVDGAYGGAGLFAPSVRPAFAGISRADSLVVDPHKWLFAPADYAYHLTRRARGMPLWFSLAVHGTAAYTRAIEAAIGLARETAADIRGRDYLELIREPDLSVVLFRRRGWSPAQYTRWADHLLSDQVAFLPPSAWEGETVARLAFLHPHTPMSLCRQVLDRMA